MIEKLKITASDTAIILKINELVEAVNKLQKDYDNVCVWVGEQKLKAPTDPYAEQRNYLCKLCWFWNENYEDGVIGVLTGVFDNADRPFERNIDQTLYKHCEPVKPDDDIIYKGE